MSDDEVPPGVEMALEQLSVGVEPWACSVTIAAGIGRVLGEVAVPALAFGTRLAITSAAEADSGVGAIDQVLAELARRIERPELRTSRLGWVTPALWRDARVFIRHLTAPGDELMRDLGTADSASHLLGHLPAFVCALNAVELSAAVRSTPPAEEARRLAALIRAARTT